MKGIGPGSAQLLRWGVPQHVLTSGAQLGHYLAEDVELQHAWAERQSFGPHGGSGFLSYLVSKVNEGFDIQYRTSLQQCGLFIAPRPLPAPPAPPPARSSSAPPVPPPALEVEEEPEDEPETEEPPPEVASAQTEPVRMRPRMMLKAVRRAMTLTLESRKEPITPRQPRPATVMGCESGATGLLNIPRPPRKPPRRTLQSSFTLWDEKRTKEEDDQKRWQMVQKKRSSRKVDAALQLSVRKALPLNVSKKQAGKIVQDQGELRRVFDFYDRDGSDSIDPEEFPALLSRVLKQHTESMDKEELWRIWDEIDDDGSGHISFEEFQKWYCKAFRIDGTPDRTSFISAEQVPQHEGMIRHIAKKLNLDFFKVDSLWSRFSSFDLDKSGTLDYTEFTRLIQKELAPPSGAALVPDKVVEKFWIEVDSDKSGLISFGEFCAWYMTFLFGGKSPMEQYYAAFSSRSSLHNTLGRDEARPRLESNS